MRIQISKAFWWLFFFIVITLLAFQSRAATDVYKFSMHLKIPRVYDNMQSQGFRKYQWQKVEGDLRISYAEKEGKTTEVSVSNVINRTYLVGGKNLTYEPEELGENPPKINLIGSNKTKAFKTPSVSFSLELSPSYNISATPNEDNTLVISLSGSGNTSKSKVKGCQVIKSLSGNVTGRLGCSCSDFGHMSPTRVAGPFGPILGAVDDIAAVWGSWKAVWKRREN